MNDLVPYNPNINNDSAVVSLVEKMFNKKQENTHIFPQDINIIVQQILYGLDDIYNKTKHLPDFIEIRGSRLCHFLADSIKDNNFNCPVIPINLVLEDTILLIRRGRNVSGNKLEEDLVVKINVIFDNNRVNKVEKIFDNETTTTDYFILKEK